MIKKVKKIVPLIAIVIIILVILSCICFGKKKTKANGNCSNSGLVVQDAKNNVYYYKYGIGIYRFDGKNEDELITENNAYSLVLDEKNLYYLSNENVNNIEIKKINVETKETQKVCDISTSINKIFVNKNYIYYISYNGDGGIIRIDENSLEKESILTGSVDDFQIDFSSKTIYFVNGENKICSSDLEGNEIKILNGNVKANKIQVIDNWIYFYDTNENALFRIKTNGKETTLISTLVKNDIYNVFEKNIYYFDEENKSIMKMKINKSNDVEKIVDLEVSKTKINVTNDKIYYLDKSQNEDQVYQIFKVNLNGENKE